MAGIPHYINTAAVEPSRSRTPSLVTTQPQPFPVLFVGDTRPHLFFFHQNGTIEDFSGAVGYTLTVTVGKPNGGPQGGTYAVTYGADTTPALPFDTLAVDLAAALNALQDVIDDGGVTVEGEFPTFLVYNSAVGSVPTMTVSAALLAPDSNAVVTVLTTGTGSVRQQTQIALRRLAVAAQSTWTRISSPYAGWSGTLSTNTESALALLADSGEDVGGYLQAETVVSAEVTDASNNIVAYYQQTVFLRGKNSDFGATTVPAVSTQLVTANSTTGALVSPTNFFSGNKQSGTVTLTAGAGSITNANITASSVIAFSMRTPGGTPGTAQPFATPTTGSAIVTGLGTDSSTWNWFLLR